jgi:serine protease
VLHAFAEPGDPEYDLQWHYRQIHLPEAWDLAPDASGVIVAVLDSGITPHPDLAANVITGYDFIADPQWANDGNGVDPDPTDSVPTLSHGTHVAGIVGAVTNNGVGVAGVAWGVKIMPVRVIGWIGASNFDVANGVRYAARLTNVSGSLPAQRAHVINMSLGGGPSNVTLSDACTAARNAGVVVIAAAGNDGTSVVSFPAAYDGVIAVGASNALNQRAWYSSYGARLDLLAPGGDPSMDATGDGFPDGVLSTLWDGSVTPPRATYEYYQGTSMAAPHVAGVAALMLAEDPTLTPAEVESALTSTASDLETTGFDESTGWGLVDAYRAVQAVQIGPPVFDPARLRMDVDSADFGAVESERHLRISNLGDDFLTVGPPTVTTVTGGPWLTGTLVAPGTSLANATALRIVIDRSGMLPGGYVGEIELTSNGGTWRVRVTMAVLQDFPPLPAIPLRLFVRSVDTGEVVRFVDVDANTSYAWTIPSLPVGRYLLFAGTDLDSDGAYDDDGEYVGAWPTLDQPQMVQISAGHTFSGLRLTVSPRTSIDSTASKRR